MKLKQNWKMNDEKLEAQELQLFDEKNHHTDSLGSGCNSSKRSQLYSSSSRKKNNSGGELHQQTKLMHTFGILLVTFTILHGLTSLFTLSFYPLIDIMFCAMVCSVVDKISELRGDNDNNHDDNDDDDDNDWSLRRKALLRWKRIHLSVFVSYLLVRLGLLLLFGWSTSWRDALLKNFSDTPPTRTLHIGKWSFTHVWISYLFSVTQIGIFVNGCALLYVSYNMWQYLNEKTRENELRKGNNGVEQV